MDLAVLERSAAVAAVLRHKEHSCWTMFSVLRGKVHWERKQPMLATALPSAASRALDRLSGTALEWIWQCWSAAQPWPQFFDTKQFTAPQGALELKERLAINIPYYRGNYIILGCGLLILAALLRPVIVVAAILLFLLYSYLFYGQLENFYPWWTTRRKHVAFGVAAALVAYGVDAIGTISSTLVVAALLALVHSACHKCNDEVDFEANLPNGR
jgi:hypothetical protein